MKWKRLQARGNAEQVALRGRAWIEIIMNAACFSVSSVALRGRAWIEIRQWELRKLSLMGRPPREGVD